MHESSMNSAWMHFSTFSPSRNPNHQSKTPLWKNWRDVLPDFLLNRIDAVFTPDSCRFHAGFMQIYIYAGFMSDSCQIHAGFSCFQRCHLSILHYVVFMPFSCRFQAFSYLRRIHVRFMPDSVEFTILVSCALSNLLDRISITDPASAATSFVKTLKWGDPALSHSWWACLNKVCKWVVGKVVLKCVVTPRAPFKKSEISI